MSWDRVEGQWKQQRGRAANQWGKATNDELATIAGKYEELVGRLQEEYEIVKEDGKRQVEHYRKMAEQLKISNSKLIETQKASSKVKKGGRIR